MEQMSFLVSREVCCSPGKLPCTRPFSRAYGSDNDIVTREVLLESLYRLNGMPKIQDCFAPTYFAGVIYRPGGKKLAAGALC